MTGCVSPTVGSRSPSFLLSSLGKSQVLCSVQTHRWIGWQCPGGTLELQHSRKGTAVTHRPVVVQVTQFEREPLHVVGLQAVVIVDDVIVGGVHGSPTGDLADQVKVVAEGEKRMEGR